MSVNCDWIVGKSTMVRIMGFAGCFCDPDCPGAPGAGIFSLSTSLSSLTSAALAGWSAFVRFFWEKGTCGDGVMKLLELWMEKGVLPPSAELLVSFLGSAPRDL
jgi:hypothetical protein